MKLLFRLIIAFVLLIVIAGVVVYFYIDRLAARGIERGATYALGVETSVGSARVGLFGGELDLSNVKIDNPDGFNSDHFLTLDDGSVAVSLGSLMDDTVRVPRLSLTDIDMNLEKREGKSNYDVILGNLERFESGDVPAEPSSTKKFIIDEVVVTNVNVHVDLLPLAGELTKMDVPIDEIRLRNVGSDGNRGVLIAELSGVLIKAIIAAVIDKGVNLPPDLVGDLTGKLANLESLSDLGIDLTRILGEGVGKTTGGAAKEIGEQAEDVIKGIGGLLGDDKKRKSDRDKKN